MAAIGATYDISPRRFVPARPGPAARHPVGPARTAAFILPALLLLLVVVLVLGCVALMTRWPKPPSITPVWQ